jgi:glucosamine 6-phosphate synthetase-like amidotransferase/phosphosugar isomerase protein
MCGISGIVLLKKERTENMWAAIRYLFDEILVETQDRGHHATGLVSFLRDGSSYEMHKAAVEAKMFTTFDEQYDSIIRNIDDNTASIISHTRYYTKGKPDNNNNNHPFDIGNVVGVHNGTISNDDELFKQYEGRFERIAEVDSEIIYQLINYYNQDKITYQGLRNALEETKLRGMFALAFAHKAQPHLVHIVKQDRPMDFVYWEEAGVLFFNSEKKFILDSFNKLRRVGKRFNICETFTLKEYELKANNYVMLDSTADSYETMISEPVSILIASSVSKVTYTNNEYWNTRGTNSTNSTRVSASDSIGMIIEGELDPITGEVIIYTSAQAAGVDEEDGEEENEIVFCAECEDALQEHEVHAAYNEGAANDNTYYCAKCHQQALTALFPTV